MNDAVFKTVRESVERMDSKMPRWLDKGESPSFQVVKQGDKGPTIVFLHGLFGALSNWDSVLPQFADFAKCIALEFPILTGHTSEVKVKALAAYAEYYIRSNNLGPVILCGNSLGGHVALRLALSSPELVDALLLSGSSGLYEHTADALPVRPSSQFIRDHMGRVFFNNEFITDDAVNEILQILSKRANHLNLIHAARSAKKDNMQHLLNQIKVPTLLLWGEDDEVTTMQVAQIFENEIPNSKLVSINGCGHAPMIEHPEWFAKESKTFLEEQGAFKQI